MDRRQGLTLALLGLAACGGKPAPRRANGADVEVLARGTLGYAVAFAGEHVISVELGETFELVVRGDGPARRVALGGPDRDWLALAATPTRAWVGGETGEVVEVDLATATITTRWPVGAPITALAASEAFLVIGDAEGVLCVRRTDDGALLQCLTAHDHPIRELEIRGDLVTTRAPDAEDDAQLPFLSWSLPALAREDAIDLRELVARRDRVEYLTDDDPELLVQMAGAVQDFAVAPSGQIAVAAWITALDQASIVIVTPQR